METTIKIIAQQINAKTGEVMNQHAVFEKEATLPQKINDLGFSHKEQIEILRQSQEAILHAQETIINDNVATCPECGNKTIKKGKFDSDFHSVFTDHKLKMQRTRCTCGWTSKISIDGTFGSALHPDLVELQSLHGSENSFKKTEEFLGKKCCTNRPINNHGRIQKTVNHMGRLLSQIKQDQQWASRAANDSAHSNELTLTIDGAHIYSNDKNKRSIEVLTATVYNPKNVIKKDKHHNKILSKTVIGSAKSDRQQSVKILTQHACLKQGMTKQTQLTVVTDGAKNCWSVISGLEKECGDLITILDWFHIGKQFKNAEHAIPEDLKEEYNKAKWCLWHGNVNKSLLKLKNIKPKLDQYQDKILGLMTYIKTNRSYIVSYHDREKSGKVFTSQLAESTVNNLVNERQKHDKRMQWSREGADAVLQIRSSRQSGDWQQDWESAQKLMYRKAG